MGFLKYPHLFEPIRLGNQIYRNRIFGAPTGIKDTIFPGQAPTDNGIAYYARKAKGGVATVTIGEGNVDTKHGLSYPNYTAMDDQSGLYGLGRFCDSVRRYGAVPCVELNHAGLYSTCSYEMGNPIYAPVAMKSGAGCVFPRDVDTLIPEMPEDMIEYTITRYADAAAYAKHCGFGMVLLHGGHGWLLGQFMSSRINTRKDKWGGSLENRMRLTLAVVEAIKKRCGRGFPVEFRMSGDECTSFGYDFDEGKAIAQMLDQKVDLIHVSTGHHEDHDAMVITHPGMFKQEGMNVHYAADIKKLVSTPVGAIGGLSDPEVMEEILASGKADVIHVARALICDPDMPNKARAGKRDEIRMCMRCLTCLAHVVTNSTICCPLNPEIGRENDKKTIAPAPVKKKVLIIGGGIAGMQSALTAAKAGHEVLLYESLEKLGGVLRCEDEVPFKARLRRYLDQQEKLVYEAGVEVHLNTPVTHEMAEEIGADVILAAVGSRAAIPPIDGIDREIVKFAEDVYIHPELAGDNVVILGGGLVGMEMAIFLAKEGRKITIVEMLPEFGNGGNILHQISLDVEMKNKGIKAYLSTRAEKITDTALIAKKEDGTQLVLEADTVINAAGRVANSDIAASFYDCAKEFYIIGDCSIPKNITQATMMAAGVAENI